MKVGTNVENTNADVLLTFALNNSLKMAGVSFFTRNQFISSTRWQKRAKSVSESGLDQQPDFPG